MDRRTFIAGALLAEAAAATAQGQGQGQGQQQRPIYVGDTMPFSYLGKDKAPAGAAWEMVAEIASGLPSISLQPLVAPLIRAFKEAETRGPALIIPPARIPSREHLLRWVVPLIPVRLMLFSRQESPVDISTIEKARDLEIAVLSAPGLEETYRAAGFHKIKRLASNEAAIRMLMNDRLPAVLTADCSVYEALKEAGIPRSRIREGAVLSEVTLWLAASKDYPEAEIRLWQAEAEKRRPQLARILAKYV